MRKPSCENHRWNEADLHEDQQHRHGHRDQRGLEHRSQRPNTTSVAAHVGAFRLPNGSKDAAPVVILQPGVHTVHASGTGDTTGTVLVEVYELP